MDITIKRFAVTKRYPLTISRGTSVGSENLLVTVEHEGVTGIGEMAPTSGGPMAETAETAQISLERWTPLLPTFRPGTCSALKSLLNVQEGERAAFALSIAPCTTGRASGCNCPSGNCSAWILRALPPTSLTVGINPPDVIRVAFPELLARTGAKFLKVKLGNPAGIEADKASFAAAQEAANRRLAAAQIQDPPVGWRVDANGGWTVRTKPAHASWLAERGV